MAGNPGIPILLTRPEAQSLAYRDQLVSQFGNAIRVIVSPLIDIVTLDTNPDLEGVTALAFTSVNGVSAFASKTARRDFACFCVGDKTARTANKLGFHAVSAKGNAEDLVALVADASPKGIVLYVHGRSVAVDAASILSQAGLNVRSVCLYDQQARALDPAVSDEIRLGGKMIVPLFSPRSAELLVDALTGLPMPSVHFACLSENVARKLAGISETSIRIASRPDSESLTREIAALL